jgi:hypothetical protein
MGSERGWTWVLVSLVVEEYGVELGLQVSMLKRVRRSVAYLV